MMEHEEEEALPGYSRPRVFVVQESLVRGSSGRPRPKVDLSPAERFGKLVYLLDWSELREGASGSEDRIIWLLREALRDFSDEDYLLLIGSFSAMVMAAMVAAESNSGKVRLLEWNRNGGDYRVIALDMNCQPLPEMEKYEHLAADHRARRATA